MTSSQHALDFAHEASLGLPGSIKQVADFLLSEGTGIEQLTMREIAARAYTSKPTLVRFAKQAGYAGWKDYRRDFLVAMGAEEERLARQREVDVNTPFGPNATADEVVGSLARIQRLAVTEMEESLDRDALARAADILLSSHDLVHFGVMHNYQLGKIFASNLSLIGLLCRTPQTNAEAASIANHLSREDCVVVTSYSGGLEHIPMAFVPMLRERGVSVIAVTNSRHSPLALIADVALTYTPLEHFHAKIADFYSGACTQFILNSLYAACYARRFEQSRASRRGVIEGVSAIAPADFGHMDD